MNDIEYGLNRETLDALNDFSCNIEHLKRSLAVLNSLVWAAVEDNEEALEQAAHLSETLLEIATIRDKEIGQLVGQIKPLTLPPL